MKARNLFILFLIIGAFACYQIIKIANNKSSRLKIVNSIPAEYSSLFVQGEKKMSSVKSYVLYKTTINPVSDFYYDNKYCIVVTKLKTKNLDSLPAVYVKQGKPKLTNGHVYAGFDIGHFTLNMLPDSGRISNIVLTYNGDSIKNISKKDLIAYRVDIKSIGISYDDGGKTNLKMESSNHRIPSCIVFLRHGQSSYFISIFAQDSVGKINESESFDLNQILIEN